MRRVKLIALAMAAVLAGAINMMATGSDGAADKPSDHDNSGARTVSAVRASHEAASRYSMVGDRLLADATAGAASARAEAQARKLKVLATKARLEREKAAAQAKALRDAATKARLERERVEAAAAAQAPAEAAVWPSCTLHR